MGRIAIKVIASTHYNRPKYTKQCFEHLSKCVGIENYLLVLGVEPGNQEVIDLCRGINFCDYMLKTNEQRMGCNANIGDTLGLAFRFSDYVIMLEDDILFAKDTLLYFEQFEKYKNENLLNISAYHRKSDPNEPYKTTKRRWFTPWGWATWRNRYEFLTHAWTAKHPSWDCFWNDSKMHEIYPVWSRSQNIGWENGTYCPGFQFHRENQWVENWAGDQEYEIKEFIYE